MVFLAGSSEDVFPWSFEDTFLPFEYPTVVLEFAVAAVWRMEDGLVGALVFLEPRRDEVAFNLDAGAGWGRAPDKAAAAARDLMVETPALGLCCPVVFLVARWVVGFVSCSVALR